jgi:hypothetical protein
MLLADADDWAEILAANRKVFVMYLNRLLIAAAFAAVSIPARAEDGATRCEKMVIDELRSPATYERVSIEESSFPMNEVAFKRRRLEQMEEKGLTGAPWDEAYKALEAELAAIKENPESAPRLDRIVVEFDAQNAYGGLLRETATCVFDKEPLVFEFNNRANVEKAARLGRNG